jgi:predicted GNAT superfamily acetyltransferase
MKKIVIKIMETYEELLKSEELQHKIYAGSAIDIVPTHLLLALIHNGGIVIGAYEVEIEGAGDICAVDEHVLEISQEEGLSGSTLIGFVFGFPGIYQTEAGPQLKHHSHMMGVLESYRDRGIGFMLKRTQWQIVRHQKLDRITWTFDPLISRNAHLNIARLGAVCNTYFREYYGDMRDGINKGISSDRFQVDLWVNSQRVLTRLSKKPRIKLDLAHFLEAQIPILNPTNMDAQGCPIPRTEKPSDFIHQGVPLENPMLLVEIPADFLSLKSANFELAVLWRKHTREIFTTLFENGYLITDFIHLTGTYPRSFYVLSYGESTL